MEGAITATVGQALLVAFFFGVRWGGNYVSCSMGDSVDMMLMGLIIGIIFGKVEVAVKASAVIQLLYIGLIAPGANLPSDPQWAMLVGVLVVCCNPNLTADDAAIIAVPCGLLGLQIYNLKRIVMAFWVHKADKAAAEGNTKKIVRYGTLCAFITNFLMYGVPAFFIALYGLPLVNWILNNIPEWLWNGLDAAAGALPAIGIGMCIKVIGQKKLLPFFFAGFFIPAYWGVGLMPMALAGAFLAYLYITFAPKEEL